MNNIAVFASGFGSNFQAIIDSIENKHLNANLKILISDKSNCLAIERAHNKKIEVLAIDTKAYDSKAHYEEIILSKLNELKIDLIVLAGYMRIIGPTLLKGFKGKILNIHPSLLPLYKGKDAIGQAINDNAKTTGVTVHYVNEELDSGEIIEQVSIDISHYHGDKNKIELDIHKIEHHIYPKVIKKVLEEMK